MNEIGSKLIINFIIIILSSVILINIFFGKKNIFKFKKENLIKVSLNKDLEIIKNEIKNYEFLILQFKHGNEDFIETVIKKKLFLKGKDEKIIFY